MDQALESFPPLNTTQLGMPPWRPPAFPSPATAPPSCDILIVGAGITGLAAASVCARAGRHVVVLERAFGTGATARSGGVVLGDTLIGPDETFDGCDRELGEWIHQSGTDCGLTWCGCLELARDSRLPETPIDWHDEGPVRLAGRVAGGVLDPAQLQSGLAAHAHGNGAAIVDGVTVLKVEPLGEGVLISTDQGPARARQAIMAVDAMSWRREFDPWDQRVMTVALHTAPLEAVDLEALGLVPHQAFYTIDLPLLWGRVMPDQSLLVGRETRPFPSVDDLADVGHGVRVAGGRLSSRVRALHPVLSDLTILEIWTGPIARSAAGHPAIVADPLVPHLYWAGGYGGQGLAQAFRLGRLTAERVLSTT